MNQQTMNCSICPDEKGSLLIGLVIVMTLMAVMATGVYQFTSNTSFGGLFANNTAMAYYLAESGGLFAVPQVKTNPGVATTNLNGQTYTLSNGKFFLTIDNSNPSYTLIYSTGVVNEGSWFEARRQITYKILKTFSDPFSTQANFDTNYTQTAVTEADVKNTGSTDNQPAVNLERKENLVSYNWDGYNGVANSNAPNLVNLRTQSDNLLSYELQLKVKEDAQGSRGKHLMIGLSFRLETNDNTIATDDTYYGVSFFRSICNPATTPYCANDNNQQSEAPWIYTPNTHSLLYDDFAGFSQVMSTVTTFDKAFTYTGSYADVTTAFGSAVTDVQIFTANNSYIYLGQSTTFDAIQVDLAIGASGGSGVRPTFEYSRGSGNWTTFSPTDGTNKFRNTGTNYIDWNSPLTGWATDTVNGAASKYWIRIKRTQSSLTTPPTENTIKAYYYGPQYVILWKKVNGVYSLLDYKKLTAADNVLNSDGSLKAWSTIIAKVVEQYQTIGGNRVDDGTGLCATDNNHCLRDNLITVYVQGACTADTTDNTCSGTVLYPLNTINWTYSNFNLTIWDWKVSGQTVDSPQTIHDSTVTSSHTSGVYTGFTSAREEIGFHGYYDSNAANDQFLDDFAMNLLSSGGAGTGDIQY